MDQDKRNLEKDEAEKKKDLLQKAPPGKKDIVQNTVPEKTELLETQLKNGVKIQNQEHYESFMNLLQKNSIIKAFPSFQALNDFGEGTKTELNHFLIQKKEGSDSLTVFLREIDTLTYQKPSEIYYQLGTIDQNGTYQISPSREVVYTQNLPQLETKSPSKTPSKFTPTRDSIDLALGVINEKALQKGAEKPYFYTIKAGDSLWEIVKNNYNLGENTHENNTKIANIIKAILKMNPQIKDINKIYANQTIKLPQMKK